jgi:hypothetical protein
MFGNVRILAIKNINKSVAYFSKRVNEAALHNNAENEEKMMPILCLSITPNIFIKYNLQY